ASFTARCGPCLRIAPAFNALSNKYPQATFLEVDVHQCQGTAATNNISATPTFLFFRNKVRIDQYQGADAVGLEEKIKQHLENDPGNNEDTDIPKGYMDLMPFINKAGCECLNESDEHGFDNCLRKDSTYLESDCDEQLLITVAFSQPVKLYSMKLQGPDNGQGPKYIKIFINLPRSMDFEEAERSEPTQALELTPDDIKEDGIIQLRYVKFQNVNSVTWRRVEPGEVQGFSPGSVICFQHQSSELGELESLASSEKCPAPREMLVTARRGPGELRGPHSGPLCIG
ncbi:PREDICTED: thioredoxin-like protein 1, partial [Cariama cristata]|uniref:thioredoxin-like protein 1 n=1 Tax=Cariama cristata TaxID=54380 RepID=UPI000520EF12